MSMHDDCDVMLISSKRGDLLRHMYACQSLFTLAAVCVGVCRCIGAGPVFAHAVEQAGRDFGGGVL